MRSCLCWSLVTVCGSGLLPRPATAQNSAASISAELRQLSIDPAQTYRTRELEIVRGDIKIYLTEGILAFAKPVAGQTVAAVFTTSQTDAGDGEILVLPPTRSERAALASFTKSPNLDEHLQSAVFFFSDETAKELQDQLRDKQLQLAPEEAKELADTAARVLRIDSQQIDVKLARALLDRHAPADGFFYGILGGRNLGVFDVVYEPPRFESISIGRVAAIAEGAQSFQVWSSFRPRRSPPPLVASGGITDYRLETVIHPDLSMSSQAKFEYRADSEDGRTISLELSNHLRLTAAKVDGQPAEVFQHTQDVDNRRAREARSCSSPLRHLPPAPPTKLKFPMKGRWSGAPHPETTSWMSVIPGIPSCRPCLPRSI